jgi:hypothetical protein
MDMGIVVRAIWYLNVGLTFVVLFRLLLTGLFRIYRNLFLFLLVNAAEALLLAHFQFNNLNRYAEVYMGSQALKMMLSIFMVLELYRVVLAGHPALARFGRRAVVYALGLAAVIAASGVVLDTSVMPGQSRTLHHFFTAERTMDFAVLMFLLLISGFTLWFPIGMKWNVALYLAGFVVFSGAQSFGLLMANILPRGFFNLMSDVMLWVSLGCLLTWLFALRSEEEQAITIVGHRWNPAAMERLSGQLETINTALVRLGRH